MEDRIVLTHNSKFIGNKMDLNEVASDAVNDAMKLALEDFDPSEYIDDREMRQTIEGEFEKWFDSSFELKDYVDVDDLVNEQIREHMDETVDGVIDNDMVEKHIDKWLEKNGLDCSVRTKLSEYTDEVRLLRNKEEKLQEDNRKIAQENVLLRAKFDRLMLDFVKLGQEFEDLIAKQSKPFWRFW